MWCAQCSRHLADDVLECEVIGVCQPQRVDTGNGLTPALVLLLTDLKTRAFRGKEREEQFVKNPADGGRAGRAVLTATCVKPVLMVFFIFIISFL